MAAVLVVARAHPVALAAEMFDSPETPWASEALQQPEAQSCDEIDQVFVMPVRAAERAGAVRRLRDESAFPIDYTEVARLGFAEPPAVEKLHYASLLRQEIDRLHAERRRNVEAWEGKWSQGDEERLNGLVDLAHESGARLLVPFLVRAVATDGSTGSFHARICRTGLWIDHVSRGGADAPVLRLPVIIYLAQRPEAVYATWSVQSYLMKEERP